MNRREILRYTALVTGAAVSSPLWSAILAGCGTKGSDDTGYVPKFFSEDEFTQITDLVDTILPKTKSPSASEVGVHRIIDEMVGSVYRANEKEGYRKKFDTFQEYLKNTDFEGADTGAKIKLLTSLSSSSDSTTVEARSFFIELKQQTVALYLNNEEIAKTYLNYLPVPGKYEACIPLNQTDNKAWHYEF